ncbi:hypothetical protein D5b_00201 [Faustovirus]|nr:hypothetical protein D5b_00201 [Faustovirus]AMN84713.1 hypothetical protein D6_00310 [Faustovirus]AMP44155.1 hypothetical protein PRJ_Dakar_00199 [Faustovirus]QKE50397.1 hypothetical protein F-VV10_0277 [Faustovirus]
MTSTLPAACLTNIESAGVFCIDAATGNVMLGLIKEGELKWDWIGGKYENEDIKVLESPNCDRTKYTDLELVVRQTLAREMWEEVNMETANFISKYANNYISIYNGNTKKYVYVFTALIEDVATLDELANRPRIGSPHMGYHWLSRAQLTAAIATGTHNEFKLRGFLKILFANPDVRKLLGV